MVPIVFLHGLYQGLGHLRDLPFPSARPVFVLDLLGFGEHAGATVTGTIQEQVDHTVAEMDRLGVPTAVIVGHSIGGAVAMLLAASHPNRVTAVVNVEGNFTLADAFWSSKVAAMSSEEAETMLENSRQDVEGWLSRQKMDATPQRVAWAKRMFDAQPARSVQALARAVVDAIASPDYRKTLDGVLDSGVPVHLIAGERSRAGWAVNADFIRRAASFKVQPRVGHMMPIEDPDGFLALVASRVGEGAAG